MARTMGISVALQHQETVKTALYNLFRRQQDLAEDLGIARSTVQSFLYGKRVSRLNFEEICRKLQLDWQAIANLPTSTEVPSESHQLATSSIETGEIDESGNSNTQDLDINTLVERVRQKCHNRIQELYGKIRPFDISQPIDINKLHVNVKILEQPNRQRCLAISTLLQQFSLNNDSFGQIISGLDAVKKYPKLMLFGKPGSGKSTFLQYLAVQCNQGNFQADKVPILINLKDFARVARENSDLKLFNYIRQKLYRCCNISAEELKKILDNGRGIILLDGLNEVPADDEEKVVEQIHNFAQDYDSNKLIVTCRTAASQPMFDKFTDVEVADFDAEQIQSFAEKWFAAIAQTNPQAGQTLAEQFIEQLNRPNNERIRELAVTPLLLHLTCLGFQSQAEFPSNRAGLYEQRLDILLVRWNRIKGVRRSEVYHNLSLEEKINLLSHIAAIAFETNRYFFEKTEIERWIADYLRTLPNAQTTRLRLQKDSENVLRAIEAQHGILVEQARDIYSFSNLTFQEYFTAQKIVTDIEKKGIAPLQNLVSHITDKRWREVFLLTVGMLPNPDSLLQLMKQQVDGILADDENLQQFLVWLNQKSVSVPATYRIAAVRAVYFALDRVLDRVLNPDDIPTFFPALELVLDPAIKRFFDPAVSPAIQRILELAVDLDLIPTFIPALIPGIKRALDLALKLVILPVLATGLKTSLQPLQAQLGDRHKIEFNQWWKANGQAWTEQLRAVLIEYANIGHDWQFSEQQKQLLKQYYNANRLLLDCLNSNCDVSTAVRQEIEDTLLLPIAEINGSC